MEMDPIMATLLPSTDKRLRSPFPWFGGKSRVAHLVWERFGDVPNYTEPFAGSLATLLGRPHWPWVGNRIETINDADAYLANFWRALQADPEGLARHADWPVNEADLHARHMWLVHSAKERVQRLQSDPDFYDAKIAGWWVWGQCMWIGSGWCRSAKDKKRPELGSFRGVLRRNQYTVLGKCDLSTYLSDLAERIRDVRVVCGDWKRICTPSTTTKIGMTGVFLDPPYAVGKERDTNLYRCENITIANDVREWTIENGDNPLFRIALCGYQGEHIMPDSWECIEWHTSGGMANTSKKKSTKGHQNAKRERIWFSPHCQGIPSVTQRQLSFGDG